MIKKTHNNSAKEFINLHIGEMFAYMDDDNKMTLGIKIDINFQDVNYKYNVANLYTGKLYNFDDEQKVLPLHEVEINYEF
jgi:hypothetical protein